MSGFFLGITAAFAWSLTNMVDKHLTQRHASDGNIWGILVLSCFFPVTVMIIAALFGSVVIESPKALLLMLAGILMVGWIFFYLKALTEDDASVVMTLLVLAPFFSLLFANLLLGETLSKVQLMAGVLLLVGSLVVSYEAHSGTMKYKLLIYSFGACAVMGLMQTLFKLVAVDASFLTSIFWRSLGMVVVGFVLVIFFKSIRKRFADFITTYAKSGLTLNATNESLTLVGDTIFGFAILLAPIALVQTTEAYQPVFIMLITFILTKLGVSFVTESYSRHDLIRKVLGIIVVLIGSLLLVQFG